MCTPGQNVGDSELAPNLSLNPDASPAALRAVRSAPVSLVRWASRQCGIRFDPKRLFSADPNSLVGEATPVV